MAVLLVSEDLEEIFELCDRIAVMFEGRFMGIVPAAQASMEEIGLMMAGSRPVASSSRMKSAGGENGSGPETGGQG
jgi:simple sugar transport system ATP-binding protein